MEDRRVIGNSALRPRARLLRTLGNDLISSDDVALIELVKNAYDADASTVVIHFQGPLAPGAGSIDIWDDGYGMSAATLQNSWLEIATDTKKKSKKSPGGRRVLGEKGIGRLASARLGSFLTLTSKIPSGDEVQLEIDWTEFDREDAYLDEIEVGWSVNQSSLFSTTGARSGLLAEFDASWKNLGQGTVLRISDLTKIWRRQDILKLRTTLMRLVRPKAITHDGADPGFRIFLVFSEVQDEISTLAGPIESSNELQRPHYQLAGSVDSAGQATLRYVQFDPPLTEDLGLTSLWEGEQASPVAGPIEFEINAWDRDKDSLSKSLKNNIASVAGSSSTAVKDFRRDLDEVAGISIYRDGFRVLPFGERGDDWLGLDLRRVQSPTRRLSNNQIIGHIFIGADENSMLRDQSNREGLLEGEAYDDLRSIVRAALTILENKRYLARRIEKTGSDDRGGLFDGFDLLDISESVKRQYPQDVQLAGMVEDKNREISRGLTEIQQVLSRYSRLATLGSLVDKVVHDGRSSITRIMNLSRFTRRDLVSKSKSDADKLELSASAFHAIDNESEVMVRTFANIEPFGGRRRGRPKVLKMKEILANVAEVHRIEIEENDIQLSIYCDDFNVTLDKAEIITVLSNLVQNAIYWTGRIDANSAKQIVLDARKNVDGTLTIYVSDSGPGVPEEHRQLIFDPYYSTRSEGVGLGLSIVGNIVEDIYNGKLKLVDGGPLSGATFEATFRKRV